MGAGEDAELILSERHSNRAYAGSWLQRLMSRLEGVGVFGGLAGEGLWFAWCKFSHAQTRSEISKTEPPCQTSSEHDLQGAKLKFAALVRRLILHENALVLQ